MTVSYHQATLAPICKALTSLKAVMDIGAKHAADSATAEADLLACKLADDMFDLSSQISVLQFLVNSQGVMRVVDRTPGTAPAAIASFADAQAMLDAILNDCQSIDADAFNEAMSQSEPLVCQLPIGEATFPSRLAFMQEWVMPHLYFHVTTAYNILRNNGAPLGKGNFLGSLNMDLKPLG